MTSPKIVQIINETTPLPNYPSWTYDEAGVSYDNAGYRYDGDAMFATGYTKPSQGEVFLQGLKGGVIVESIKGKVWL